MFSMVQRLVLVQITTVSHWVLCELRIRHNFTMENKVKKNVATTQNELPCVLHILFVANEIATAVPLATALLFDDRSTIT